MYKILLKGNPSAINFNDTSPLEMESNAIEPLPLPLVQKNFHVSIETPTGTKVLEGD